MTDNPEAVTVVVADDQAAVREGLVLLLGTLPGITVVGQAEDGLAPRWRRSRPPVPRSC